MRRAIALALLMLTAIAADAGQMAIYLENDFPYGTDRFYTHGTRIEYWPDAGNWNTSVGQNMYTPENKEAYQLLPEDRPYAGWLYGAFGVETNLSCFLVEAELQAGVIGPCSYAEQTQDFIHKITGSHLCNGWSNQIPNHLEGQAWAKISYPTDLSRWFDAVPNVTLAAGTVQDYASLGGTLYLGYNLPKLKPNKDIPIKRPSDPDSGFRIYLHGGGEVRGVAWNAFLEDPRFDIDVCPVVYRGCAGFTTEWSGYALTFQIEEMSYEFEQQASPAKFGSVQLTFKF